MKKTVKAVALSAVVLLLTAGFSLTSCAKKNREQLREIKNITLDVTLQAGETYNLDLSRYGVQHATCAITKQPINAGGSTLTTTNTNPFTANYQYTASPDVIVDQVIIQVNEDDGSKGSWQHDDGNGGKTEKCGGGKQSHPAITNITINLNRNTTNT